MGRVSEQVTVEKEARGEVRALREELAVVATGIVVAVAVVLGEVGVGVGGGMGVQGRLGGPQREGGRGVGAVHGGTGSEIRGGRRRVRAPAAARPPKKDASGGGVQLVCRLAWSGDGDCL